MILNLLETIVSTISILLTFTILIYLCGIRLFHAFNLSLIISDMFLLIIHHFNIDNNNQVIYNESNLFIAIYLLSNTIYYIIITTIISIRNRYKLWCCNKTINTTDLYKTDDENNIEENINNNIIEDKGLIYTDYSDDNFTI